MMNYKFVTEEEKDMARAVFRLLRALDVIEWQQAPQAWVSLLNYLENKRMKELD